MMPSNKRIVETRTDWFEELPDSLLIHILSFLDVREAAITSVLSKRWKSLWSELPRLEFENEEMGMEMDGVNFVSMVNRTIAIREGNYLEKFMVAFVYNECFASDVDAWVEFCVKNKVKQLILDLITCRGEYYTLPRVMYSCSFLTTLNLGGCILAYEGIIAWKSLTDLTLSDVELNQHLLVEILSSCPVLNNLDLTSCCGFDRLEVNSQCLKSLAIEESEDEPIVEISAPYIRSLDITKLAHARKTALNISSVVTASINLDEFDRDNLVEMMDNAKDFLENFKHVNDLRLHFQVFEVLSEMAVNGWRLPQFRLLQHLKINSLSEYKFSISGIFCLLESSPNLETLFLNGYRTRKTADFHPAAKGDLDGDLLHLREIAVCNFADPKGEPLLTLASILLRRAPALEEMVIEVNVSKTSEYINICQALLTYPRSSSKAEIHLSRELC